MDSLEHGADYMKQGSIKVWLKPQQGSMAVFVLNDGSGDEDVAIVFADLQWRDVAVPTSGRVKVTSVWDGTVTYEEGEFQTGVISPHDSRLYFGALRLSSGASAFCLLYKVSGEFAAS